MIDPREARVLRKAYVVAEAVTDASVKSMSPVRLRALVAQGQVIEAELERAAHLERLAASVSDVTLREGYWKLAGDIRRKYAALRR